MAQVIKFASDIDGKEFNTQSEQLAYDASIQNKAVIDAFLDKHYPAGGGKKQGPSRAIVGKGIALWLSSQVAAE
jgi:hypothetical protein